MNMSIIYKAPSSSMLIMITKLNPKNLPSLFRKMRVSMNYILWIFEKVTISVACWVKPQRKIWHHTLKRHSHLKRHKAEYCVYMLVYMTLYYGTIIHTKHESSPHTAPPHVFCTMWIVKKGTIYIQPELVCIARKIVEYSIIQWW